MSRRIQLQGVDNFRDFGGYAASGGRRLKVGALYRSAGHARATDADLKVIAGLGLVVVVDLRRPDERRRDPSRLWEVFRGLIIENAEEAPDDWRGHIARGDISEAGFRRYMVEYYRAAPFHSRHVDLFSRYFRALAGADGPVLVHCSAGKDRTGLVAALTHRIAGVHRDDVIEDYLLTNDQERMAIRLPLVKTLVSELAGKIPEDDAVRVAMGVEPLFLETAFTAIDERFGGLHAYLERVLGIDHTVRAELEARLLE